MNLTHHQTVGDRKSVSFNSLVAIHETLHICDFTKAERQAYWLSRSEHARTRLEVRSTANELSKRQSQRDQTYTRGIEAYSDEKIELRRLVRRMAQRAVFEEQDFQRLQGIPNDERIASVYESQASKSQQQAQKIAQNDQKQACGLYFGIAKKSRGNPFRGSPKIRAKSLRRLSSRIFVINR